MSSNSEYEQRRCFDEGSESVKNITVAKLDLNNILNYIESKEFEDSVMETLKEMQNGTRKE